LETMPASAPVEGVRLRLEPVAARNSPRSLFREGLRDPARFEATFSRLERLVGPGRVGSPRRADSRRPGSFELVPLAAKLDDRGAEDGDPPCGLPLRRFVRGPKASDPGEVSRPSGVPQGGRLEVRCDSGDRPVEIRSALASGAIVSALGPWRCDGDWWEADRCWSLEEWDVQLRGGRWLRLAKESGQWSLVGRYD
jgi:protein ImuB